MVPNRTDDLCEASYLEPQLIDEVGYSMTRYYFDTRDGAEFIRDELGIELDGIEAARDEASAALPILPGTRFPAPFGGSLRSSVATKPTATFSGPPYGLRLLCLLGNGTNLLKWKARAAPHGFPTLALGTYA
jgi:hypothetical protein